MKLRKCESCKSYTLKEVCNCGGKGEGVEYKFVKIRNPPKRLK